MTQQILDSMNRTTGMPGCRTSPVMNYFFPQSSESGCLLQSDKLVEPTSFYFNAHEISLYVGTIMFPHRYLAERSEQRHIMQDTTSTFFLKFFFFFFLPKICKFASTCSLCEYPNIFYFSQCYYSTIKFIIDNLEVYILRHLNCKFFNLQLNLFLYVNACFKCF